MIAPKLVRPTARQEREAYEAVTLRDGGRCVRCHSEIGVQRDHRRNRSQGGWTVVENLQLMCSQHHQEKTEHPDDACREGWAVPGWSSWLSYPARRWVTTGHGTYRLAWGLYRDRIFIEITDTEAADRRAGLIRDESHLI